MFVVSCIYILGPRVVLVFGQIFLGASNLWTFRAILLRKVILFEYFLITNVCFVTHLRYLLFISHIIYGLLGFPTYFYYFKRCFFK